MPGSFRGLAPYAVFLGLAAIAYLLGNTFSTFLTIFSILIWACVAVVGAYLVLFRGMKFTLFKGDATVDAGELSSAEGFDPADGTEDR